MIVSFTSMFTLKTACKFPIVFAILPCEEEHPCNMDLCDKESLPRMDRREENRPYSRRIRDVDGEFDLMSPVRRGFYTTAEYVAMLLRYASAQDARSPSFRQKRPTPIRIPLMQDDSNNSDKVGISGRDFFEPQTRS